MNTSRELKPYTPVDMIWRSVLEIDHAGNSWAIDVDFFDWESKIHLYRNGILDESQTSPAKFHLGDGVVIEAKSGFFGMQRLHLVDGENEIMLSPADGTAEARRTRFEQDHPTASKVISAFSWTVLVIGLILLLAGLIELVARVLGFEFVSPLGLPGWLSSTLSLAGIVAGIERGLRFKANPWLDT